MSTAAKVNESFILSGSNQGKFRRISDVEPPCRRGKQMNFFSLREQLGASKESMPTKNELSTGFAVSEDKIQRRSYQFNPKNILLNDRYKNTTAFQDLKDSASVYDKKRNPANRHYSRNDGISHSIDFVFHTKLSGPRLASEGGVFPIGYSG